MACTGCDEDMYEELLTDIYGTAKFGHFEFDAGKIFRELDPIAFRCGMSEEECRCDEEDIEDLSIKRALC